MDNSLNSKNSIRRGFCLLGCILFIAAFTVLFFSAIAILEISDLEDAMSWFAYEYKTEMVDSALNNIKEIIWLAIFLSGILLLLSLVLSIAKCGVKTEDNKIRLSWFDKIFVDIQILAGLGACLLIIPSAALLSAWIRDYHARDAIIVQSLPSAAEAAIEQFSSPAWSSSYHFYPSWVLLAGGLMVAAFAAAVGLVFLLSLVKKLKNREFLKYTIAGSIFSYIYTSAVSTRHTFALVISVLVIGAFIAGTQYGLLLIIPLIFVFIPPLLKKYQEVKNGIKELSNGNLGYKVPVTGKTDLDEMAEAVNSISNAQQIAIANELKNQRLKTDLISNVSHDLRTPLTSMVTYIDLLKKEGLQSENAPKYVEIISEKTERLQKLTEDLFEAAKASSGDIPVDMDRIELSSIVSQALAELEDNFTSNNINLVVNDFPENTFVMADGRLLYRVIENLFVNVSKYTQQGTRAYLSIIDNVSSVSLEIKNISRDALNIEPSELMERFKRGDSSRNTDGSGLGLAIAKDLTSLMDGKLEIKIDGDLFKATVTLLKPTGTYQPPQQQESAQ